MMVSDMLTCALSETQDRYLSLYAALRLVQQVYSKPSVAAKFPLTFFYSLYMDSEIRSQRRPLIWLLISLPHGFDFKQPTTKVVTLYGKGKCNNEWKMVYFTCVLITNWIDPLSDNATLEYHYLFNGRLPACALHLLVAIVLRKRKFISFWRGWMRTMSLKAE